MTSLERQKLYHVADAIQEELASFEWERICDLGPVEITALAGVAIDAVKEFEGPET